ncbi:UNVERIFIED_CONTAM: hypothetical protein RMT77_014391 [Armadillidium vulgare]
MKNFTIIFILVLAINVIPFSTGFIKVSFSKDEEESQKEKDKPITEKIPKKISPKSIENVEPEPDEELQNEFISSIDYIFELVTVALKNYDPIWMDFEDKGLLNRITRTGRCSGMNQRSCIRNRKRNGFRFSKRRPNYRKPSSLDFIQRSQPLKILEKRSVPEDPLEEEEEENEEEEEEDEDENYNYDYDNGDDYVISANITTDYDYEDDPDLDERNGNVAAVPLRLVRNGKLVTRKGRGFVAGAVPFRVAPIILATDPEDRRSSNVRLILKGKIRFNFFEETSDMSSELYLVNLVTSTDFEVVMKVGKDNQRGRRAPENLRLRFQRELDSNKLRTTLETDIAELMRKILKEENASEAFYFGDYEY